MNRIKKYIILLTLLSCSCFSCVKYRNLVLLSENVTEPRDSSNYNIQTSYKLQKKDIIDISVASTDQNSVGIFTKSLNQTGVQTQTESSNYLRGYSISDSGTVEMPVIGKVKVEGLTLSEVQGKIQTIVNKYFKFVTVDIKLLSFRLTFLGEFKRTGSIIVYRDQINILQGIAEAGGFTDLSKKNKVKIIRNVDGKSIVKVLDLTKEEILDDEWYYLRPNDVIYVKPSRVKTLQLNTTSISLFLSSASLLLILANIIRN